MLNENFKYDKFKSDFVFYKFQNLLSADVIDYINNINTFEYCLIQGHRTDNKNRLWACQMVDNVFQTICQFFNTQGKDIFGKICNTSFKDCGTRIELCNDQKGSFLNNHVDDPAKLFTLQLYLSNTNASTVLANTETSAEINCGWFFVNTGTEWHTLKPLTHNRSSIIINYVNEKWRDLTVLV